MEESRNGRHTRNLILWAFSVYFPVSLFLLAFVFNLSPLPDDQDKNLVQEFKT